MVFKESSQLHKVHKTSRINNIDEAKTKTVDTLQVLDKADDVWIYSDTGYCYGIDYNKAKRVLRQNGIRFDDEIDYDIEEAADYYGVKIL